MEKLGESSNRKTVAVKTRKEVFSLIKCSPAVKQEKEQEVTLY